MMPMGELVVALCHRVVAHRSHCHRCGTRAEAFLCKESDILSAELDEARQLAVVESALRNFEDEP